ncbi:hypothetical protein RchiOBHm_Chr4g0386591 [Rosa chinensis]|uniref:Uncharacterized protein n=1 Tax=Rosa chinensis TaxID=74649 RepID=A0A2P6QP84_ROSCH|nr:hypothetical protein RchiOBHm_Chr4g0386591 [Rosa chinensis]
MIDQKHLKFLVMQLGSSPNLSPVTWTHLKETWPFHQKHLILYPVKTSNLKIIKTLKLLVVKKLENFDSKRPKLLETHLPPSLNLSPATK